MHGPGDCYLRAVAGPCDALTARWHYDSTQGDCQAFYYGGCQGNGNNFLDYDDCLAFCSKGKILAQLLRVYLLDNLDLDTGNSLICRFL